MQEKDLPTTDSHNHAFHPYYCFLFLHVVLAWLDPTFCAVWFHDQSLVLTDTSISMSHGIYIWFFKILIPVIAWIIELVPYVLLYLFPKYKP